MVVFLDFLMVFIRLLSISRSSVGLNVALVTASAPSTLSCRFRRAVQILVQVFEHCGMAIHWKPGKTEVIAVFRGNDAVKERELVQDDDGSRAFRVPKPAPQAVSSAGVQGARPAEAPTCEGATSVNMVPRYKHLGSIIDSSGSLVPEARHRVDAAMNSFGPLSIRILRKVFRGSLEACCQEKSRVVSFLPLDFV